MNSLIDSANKHRSRVFWFFLAWLTVAAKFGNVFPLQFLRKEITRKAVFPSVFLFLSLTEYIRGHCRTNAIGGRKVL